MAVQWHYTSGFAKASYRSLVQEAGFALVSLLTLLPLLLTLTIGLGGTLYILKKKSLAQSLCLRAGIQLQHELRRNLAALIDLNPKAKRLEVRRLRAQKAFRAAIISGNPSLIAVAKANKTAVLLEQMQLRAQQAHLLVDSQRARAVHKKQLHQDLQMIAARDLKTLHASQGIAVFATSARAITPEYQPKPDFTRSQLEQHEFRVDLSPPFRWPVEIPSLSQTTKCSVSIEGGHNQWHIKIIEANVPQKQCSSC